MREELTNSARDAEIARIAARQHGVVSLEQLNYDVVRFTWQQLTDDPAGVARVLRELLRK